MIPSGSRQTLFANFIQQGSSALLLLSLPNLLNPQAYAQTVFVGVLLGFMVLADFGLSLVYGRLVPALAAGNDWQAIQRWNASISVFGSSTAFLFSLALALVYWIKYRHVGHALALAVLPVGLYWVSFHVSRMTATSRFDEYRRAIGARSLASLLAIPFAMVGGISAWFLSQVVAALLVIMGIGRVSWPPLGQADWGLLRKHLPEALQLCVVTAAWTQLLNFGRLYASMFYTDEAVALYGIVGAAYQSISTLLISAFIPLTVGFLGRLGTSDQEAFEYMKTVLMRTVWWVLGGTLVATEVAIQVLGQVFPGYHFDTVTLLGLMSGIALYPFFLLFGNCMVGKQKITLYLTLIAMALTVSFLVATAVDTQFRQQGAAWGQLAGLITFTSALYFVARRMFVVASNSAWNYLGSSLLATGALVALFVGIRVQITGGSS